MSELRTNTWTRRLRRRLTRREFLRSFGRNVALGVLGLLTVALVRRNGVRGAGLEGQQCVNRGVCRGCGVFEDCGLPRALSARQALRKPSS